MHVGILYSQLNRCMELLIKQVPSLKGYRATVTREIKAFGLDTNRKVFGANIMYMYSHQMTDDHVQAALFSTYNKWVEQRNPPSTWADIPV